VHSSRNHGLDTLRALAIILVFCYHYYVFVSGTYTFGFWSDIGWVGVDLFFALSGYLIGNQIFAALRSDSGFSLTNFYARRFLRTLPSFYVILALFFLVPWFRVKGEMLPLWKFLTFTQNYQLTPGTPFSYAWSLCIEEQFYMLLPAVALLAASLRGSIKWAWALIVAAFVTGMALRASLWDPIHLTGAGGVDYYRNIYYSSFCRFDELVAGVAIAMARNYHGGLWKRMTAHGNLTFAMGMASTALTFCLLLEYHYSFAMTVLGYPMLALSFSLLIVAALSDRSVLRNMRVPGAASIALWSYAIYLTHKQVSLIASNELKQYGYGPDDLLVVLGMVALSVISGWLLYTCVESPFMRLRDRFVPSNAARPKADKLLMTPQ
jgi:peptidoglycan/LPS O-acetylase OafA/YrhL